MSLGGGRGSPVEMLQAADFLSSWTRVPKMWHASLRAPYKPPFLSSESPSCEPANAHVVKNENLSSVTHLPSQPFQ